MKTKKAAAKRFWKTAHGKVMYSRAGASHLLGHKSRKRKRRLKKVARLSRCEEKRIAPLLPH
ncbi:MAG: 50S ribosomal protein L35 [Kiritimatiellae bacterium]|nr:50S ribosomal protein L35 [Kiritimatiellia bacterium]